MSKFNQRFFEQGFEDRLTAEYRAFETKLPLQVPLATRYPTGFSHYLKGFNKPTVDDIREHINKQCHLAAKKLPVEHLNSIRKSLNIGKEHASDN